MSPKGLARRFNAMPSLLMWLNCLVADQICQSLCQRPRNLQICNHFVSKTKRFWFYSLKRKTNQWAYISSQYSQLSQFWWSDMPTIDIASIMLQDPDCAAAGEGMLITSPVSILPTHLLPIPTCPFPPPSPNRIILLRYKRSSKK